MKNNQQNKCCGKCKRKVENRTPDGEIFQWDYNCMSKGCPCHTPDRQENDVKIKQAIKNLKDAIDRQEEWEKEFVDKFAEEVFEGKEYYGNVNMQDIKSFIKSLLEAERQKLLGEIREWAEDASWEDEEGKSISYTSLTTFLDKLGKEK